MSQFFQPSETHVQVQVHKKRGAQLMMRMLKGSPMHDPFKMMDQCPDFKKCVNKICEEFAKCSDAIIELRPQKLYVKEYWWWGPAFFQQLGHIHTTTNKCGFESNVTVAYLRSVKATSSWIQNFLIYCQQFSTVVVEEDESFEQPIADLFDKLTKNAAAISDLMAAKQTPKRKRKAQSHAAVLEDSVNSQLENDASLEIIISPPKVDQEEEKEPLKAVVSVQEVPVIAKPEFDGISMRSETNTVELVKPNLAYAAIMNFKKAFDDLSDIQSPPSMNSIMSQLSMQNGMESCIEFILGNPSRYLGIYKTKCQVAGVLPQLLTDISLLDDTTIWSSAHVPQKSVAPKEATCLKTPQPKKVRIAEAYSETEDEDEELQKQLTASVKKLTDPKLSRSL